MNPETPPPAPIPVARAVQTPASPYKLEPMEGPVTLFSVIEHLLKQPGRLLHQCAHGGLNVPVLLVIAAVFSLAVFGFLLGTFSGGEQLWAAPMKVSLGVLAAVAICLPSLYIFSALGGLDARLSQICGVLLTGVALVGLLLLGFAPVVWVFSASTQSVFFMGFLAMAFWIIALHFGARLLTAVSAGLGMEGRGYLKLWMFIFLIVTLQMSTSLRPIIGTANTLLPTEKRFFVEHWLQSLSATSGGAEAASR